MPEPRRLGAVFDGIADEYERHRPFYPDALIDRACETAALTAGDEVLEVGCGTGQLTGSLLARGLRVTAVEPGERLIARAREKLGDTGQVRFVNARLEQVPLRSAGYRAAFSASAIHWIDPGVSWRALADALASGGTLALISYFGLADPSTDGDQQALRAALERISPELAAEWPVYRDLGRIRAAVGEHENVSEAWARLGSYDVARDYAADLFEDVRLTAIPSVVEHAADELNALLGTMSFWSRLSPRQRDALKSENRAVQGRLGRPIRSSIVACLLTARRVVRREAAF